ncbi:MAG: hypothetical protein WA793_01775 [Sphingorhabdus sp.]|uniref:hypothetical protein n=1 Tax=Sphingorhabdus sp. TaxID=1902408 RepID=UPI003CA5B6EA
MNILDQAARWTDIHGSKLRALERNLVRYRTYQIVLFLHKAERIKRWLEDLSRGFDPSVPLSTKSGVVPPHVTNASWKRMPPWRRAAERLNEQGYIDDKQRDTVVELVRYRNVIAHDMALLYGDIGTTRDNREFPKFAEIYPHRFEYKNLDRIVEIENQLDETVSPHFVMVLRLEWRLFDSTASFLFSELRRLKPIINRQVAPRRDEIGRVMEEIKVHSSNWNWHEGFYPRKTAYFFANGRLTPVGQKACYRLFEDGLSDLACAHLMNLSISSIKKRRRMWQQLAKG